MDSVEQPGIEVQALDVGYGDFPVLRDVSFRVN
jgi:hypothetical protein